MKTITQDFQNTLKGIKQIDAVISYADRENTNFIITQNSNFLQTEASDFLVTESAEVVIDNNGIQNVGIYWNTDLLKSCCKMLDLETSNAIPKGTELNVKIGLLIDGEYEYVDYGKFYTIAESEKKLDTGTYLTTAYDKMVKFNISINENPLTFEEDVTYTLEQYLKMICNKCDVQYNFDFSNVINSDKSVITNNPYSNDKTKTYRDALDDIAECLGTNFIINADNKITNKELLLSSLMTIDGDNLRDSNVNIGERKSDIDGIQVYDGTTMINYAGDDTSVFRIRNNNIMSANSEILIDGVLSMIRDFTYYTFSIETFGLLALEPFDCFTLSYNNTNYLLCSLNDQINTSSGLEELISYDFNEEDDVTSYKVSSSEDKLRDAYIEIDKANGQIVLKANSNGNIVQAELDASAEDGSAFNVKADNVNFSGKNFNLTSENMSISSTKFNVDNSGNLTCSNANITGGNINITSTEEQPRMKITGTISTLGTGETDIYYHGTRTKIGDLYPIQTGVARYTIDGIANVKSGRVLLKNGVNDITDMTARQFNMYNSSGTNTITLAGQDGWIYCTNISYRSKESIKKNFEKLDNALDIIKNIDIYKYNYKIEKDNDKKHIGFIIGKDYKYPKDIVVNDEGVDIYAFVSVCCKAIKEQQEQIEELKLEIKSLKGDDN